MIKYDIASDSFINYKGNGISINSLAASKIDNEWQIYLVGSKNSKGYYSKSLITNLKYDQNLNAISNIMVEITSGYSVASSLTTTLSSSDLTSDNYINTNSASTIKIDQNYLSDLVYNEDSYQQLTLSTNSSSLISIDLT